MKKVMNRIWTLAVLTIVSMAATAQDAKTVTINLNESYANGSIVVKGQEGRTVALPIPEGQTSVKVTLTVAPTGSFYITKDDIEVVYTRSIPSGTRDGQPTIDETKVELTPEEGVDPITGAGDYSFTVSEGFGAWVRSANFRDANELYDITGSSSKSSSDKVTWAFNSETKVMSIEGSGTTKNFESGQQPWASVKDQITTFVIDKGVTSLGANFFEGCTNLTTITIENSDQMIPLKETAVPENVTAINVSGNLLNEYQFTNTSLNSFKSENVIEIAGFKFTDNNSYDTFSNSTQSVVVPSVMAAYAITDIDGSKLVLTPVKEIPAGQAALVTTASNDFKSIANFYTIAAENAETVKENLLAVAGVGGQPVTLGGAYLLYNDVFYLSQAGTIPEGGIYLTIPQNSEPAKTRSSYSLGGADGTTGIHYLPTTGSLLQSAWYTLDGRQLPTAPTAKGIYINNGRKVVIK